mgnify:CR=1 FL=1
MSNKLTREVKYLQESDRPKKVEPLSFYDWMRKRFPSYHISDEWHERTLNLRATEYATYLQEFSAEEVGVELTKYSTSVDECIATSPASNFSSITYLGQDSVGAGIFLCETKSTLTKYIYFGHLHSGKF